VRFDQTIADANREEIAVFSLIVPPREDLEGQYLKDFTEGTGGPVSLTTKMDYGEQHLEEFAERTGGQVSEATQHEPDIHPLLAAMDAQWILEVSVPLPADQKLHSFKVAATQHGVTISAPKQIPIP